VHRCVGDDAWVAIACETDEQRDALTSIVGARSEDAISAWASGRTIDDVERTLQAAGVPVHGVQNSAACWADPQLQHRGHYLTVDHPVHETCVVEGPRVALSRTPGVVRRAGPSMGEHNDDVLRGILGYDDDRVTDLVIAGALG
jgi:benzylsuccinate CoA-transferase BbsF subunit